MQSSLAARTTRGLDMVFLFSPLGFTRSGRLSASHLPSLHVSTIVVSTIIVYSIVVSYSQAGRLRPQRVCFSSKIEQLSGAEIGCLSVNSGDLCGEIAISSVLLQGIR